MRLVVTDGFGKSGRGSGLLPGGKTGTAEKVAAHGGYKKHANVAAFMSVFPMNAPALRRLHDAGRAAREQEHLRLCHGRLGCRAGGRQGDRSHRADAGHAARPPWTCRRSTRRWRSHCNLGSAIRCADARSGWRIRGALANTMRRQPTASRSRPNLTVPATVSAAGDQPSGPGHPPPDWTHRNSIHRTAPHQSAKHRVVAAIGRPPLLLAEIMRHRSPT